MVNSIRPPPLGAPSLKFPTPPADFRYDINALRALAVLAVVAYHYGVPGLTGGFAGVDVFFVISGFLITSQIFEAHARGTFSFQDFYLARLRRIFPALLVMCVACVMWGWWFALPLDYLVSTRHVLAALFFLSNFAFTGETGYFDLAAHLKPLLHTWSLSVEGQFYVFLPLGMALAWRFVRSHVLALVSAACVLSLGWCVYSASLDAGDAFYMLPSRSWEFLIGSVLAVSRFQKPGDRVANVGGLLCLAVLFASFVFLNPVLHWPGYWTMMPVLAAVGLLAVRDAPLLRPMLQSLPVQRVGDVSYSLYLWHWPVLVFAKQYAVALERDLSAWELGCLMVLSLLLSVLSWRFVEQPIRARHGWWSARRFWIGLIVAWVLVLGASLPIIATKGAPKRLPDYVQRASVAIFFNTPRDECFRRSDSTKQAPEQFCGIGPGDTTSPKFVLWGDSHANQYLTVLEQAAAAIGLNGVVATQSDCRSTLAAQPTGLKAELSPGCARFNAEVNAFIEQTPSVRTIVLGRVWMGGESFSRTVALVRYLAAKGKTVIVIGPLPEPGFDVPRRWSRQQWRLGAPIESVAIAQTSQDQPHGLHARLLAELGPLVASRQVVVIDPFHRLCDATQCRVVNKGVSYYRDNSHLSHAGSLLFMDDFLSALKTVSP